MGKLVPAYVVESCAQCRFYNRIQHTCLNGSPHTGIGFEPKFIEGNIHPLCRLRTNGLTCVTMMRVVFAENSSKIPISLVQ